MKPFAAAIARPWAVLALGLGILLALLAGSCTAPAPKTYRVGFSQCTNGDAWRQAMLAGMKKELSFYPQVTFRMKDAHDNSALQQQHIQEFLREGIDLLIVSANEAEPITPIVEEVFNRGIPVVILDRRTTSKLYTAYVGGNNLEVGQTAGNYASSLLRQHGNVLEVLGAAGASPAVDRHQGFVKSLVAYPAVCTWWRRCRATGSGRRWCGRCRPPCAPTRR